LKLLKEEISFINAFMVLITLMNKIQNDEEVLNNLKNEISNIRNENLFLYEKFQIIKDKFIDHNIIS
jgi:hypothetical protein